MEAVYENATNGASVASPCNILRCHRSRLEGINNIDIMKWVPHVAFYPWWKGSYEPQNWNRQIMCRVQVTKYYEQPQGSCSLKLKQEHVEESTTTSHTHTQADQHAVGKSSAPSQCVSNYRPPVSQQVERWRPYTRRPSLVIITLPHYQQEHKHPGSTGPRTTACCFGSRTHDKSITHQLPSRDLIFMWGIENSNTIQHPKVNHSQTSKDKEREVYYRKCFSFPAKWGSTSPSSEAERHLRWTLLVQWLPLLVAQFGIS